MPRFSAASARYKHAAIAYLVYGIIYMAGAGHLGASGASGRASESGAWVWYLTGTLIVILFPWLISRGFRWFTRALVLLVLLRVYGLLSVAAGPNAQEAIPLPFGAAITTATGAIAFASVALVTAGFLARASFSRAALGEGPIEAGVDLA